MQETDPGEREDRLYGISLILLLVVYALLKKRRIGWWLVYFLIPVIILMAYQWATASVYGRGLISDASSFAIKRRELNGTELLVGLAFTGGCFSVVLFYLLQAWPRKVLAGGTVVLILTILALQFPSLLSRFQIPETSGSDAWRGGAPDGYNGICGFKCARIMCC